MTHGFANPVSIAGGAAVVALGLFVLMVAPRRSPTVAFCVFAIGFGGYFVQSAIFRLLHLPEWGAVGSAFFLAWAIGITAMAFVFPRPVGREDRTSLALAAGFAAILLAFDAAAVGLTPRAFPWQGVHAMAGAVANATIQAFLVLLVLRYRASRDATFRHQAVLTAAALTFYVSYGAGNGRFPGDGILETEGMALVASFVRLAGVILVALLWLASSEGADGRTARNMAWLTLGMALVGLLVRAISGTNWHGLTRILMAALLAYAVLRHQLLGVDVKVRWGISRGTIAAAFIAAFFVASELAQEFFGETTGSTYAGIAATGALVFAIAPLQRVAERLAERAVPPAPDPARGRRGRVELYRLAARKFLANGDLSDEDEVALAELAQELGIGAGDAMALRKDVEREARRDNLAREAD